MKKLAIVLVLLLSGITAEAQVEVDAEGFETFKMQEGDTTYLMKKYFMVFLKRGTERSQDQAEAMKIQAAHLAHMDSLAALGQLDLAGPMGDDTELRGIVVLRVPTLEDAEACVKADPAVQANRLSYEIHPWWAAVGSKLR
ncbi:YciI family protein [Croceimicrobium sp.]|uniref:YciI family protein n=1 Tax=Croceimicrobium sp. TaxID=2828340 RepID=UPI003BA9F0E7